MKKITTQALMKKAKTFLRLALPRRVVKFARLLQIKGHVLKKKHQYTKKVFQLKNQKTVRVVFFVIHSSVWKYDGLYKLLEKDPLFEPLIVVCPYTNVDNSKMMQEMQKAYDFFNDKSFNVIKSFNKKDNSWIDVQQELHPDIIFYSVPYTYTRKEYQLDYFENTLNCYVPYFFVTNGNYISNYDLLFHNLLWKSFCETKIHKRLAERYASNKGANVVVTGYPGLDPFLFNEKCEKDPWKIRDRSIKRIIWSPHHTIEGQGAGLNYSNFQKYHTFFKDLVVNQKDSMQMAFKPHPLLKEKLYKDKNWGKSRADDYYLFWSEQSNSILCESDYVDLFLTSDALIHDCSSFMAEYLSTKKPALYLLKDANVKARINEFGKMALEHHYHAFSESEVELFIEDLLQDKDPKRQARLAFVKRELVPPNNQNSSLNIFNEIKAAISNEQHN